jgi:glucose/mannose-6-phosphate isomerase
MNLDDKKHFELYDKGRVAESIELFADQIRQTLSESRLVKVPKTYSQISNVVVSGMGGSNLAAHILRSALKDKLNKPVMIVDEYEVPAYVGEKTLFILASYSGNTEETLNTYNIAKKRGAKIMGITTEGPNNKLSKLMLKDDLPGYIFKPEFNPSNQPRLALGYAYFGMSMLLAKAGLFEIDVKEMEKIISKLELRTRQLRREEQTEINDAKKLALSLENKIPVLVASGHLAGNLHALRNLINENSKQFSSYMAIPDLNHHAMEGLVYPKSNKQNLIFVFFDSSLYDKKIKKRLELTRQVVEKNGIPAVSLEFSFDSKFSQSFEMLQFGAWLSFYLGILNKENLVEIPWVDWFKKQLES